MSLAVPAGTVICITDLQQNPPQLLWKFSLGISGSREKKQWTTGRHIDSYWNGQSYLTSVLLNISITKLPGTSGHHGQLRLSIFFLMWSSGVWKTTAKHKSWQYVLHQCLLYITAVVCSLQPPYSQCSEPLTCTACHGTRREGCPVRSVRRFYHLSTLHTPNTETKKTTGTAWNNLNTSLLEVKQEFHPFAWVFPKL